jgi:NTP pyrophosphatase (non-canonical NTP hydrolase)
MSEMRKLDARQQLMVLLMEECGELIQECSKNLRKGELFDRQKFKDEVGDVYTMIDLLHEWDVVSWNEIEERREVKRNKLSKWSDLIVTQVDWENGDGGELYE